MWKCVFRRQEAAGLIQLRCRSLLTQESQYTLEPISCKFPLWHVWSVPGLVDDGLVSSVEGRFCTAACFDLTHVKHMIQGNFFSPILFSFENFKIM